MNNLKESLEHLKLYVEDLLERSEDNWYVYDINHAIDHIITDHCKDPDEDYRTKDIELE